jgi:hypothetical protein
MGFAALPQWRRHEVIAGRCLTCQMALAPDGILCTKKAFGTQAAMLFLGTLAHATDCVKETP